MKREELPEDFEKALDMVKNKRAKFVIDTIREKGFCSTEDLKNGGYEHAPRAARDVRELGIPLDTIYIKDSTGKNIAAYKFGDWEKAKQENKLLKVSGRKQLTQKLKKELLEKYGAKCNLYSEEYPSNLLQVDHRIPYEIGGDPKNMMDIKYFMLLSPAANREKSWECEHCENWLKKDLQMCCSCYYAYPENYEHVAGRKEKRINISFAENDMELYESVAKLAALDGKTYEDEIKRMIEYYDRIHQKKIK